MGELIPLQVYIKKALSKPKSPGKGYTPEEEHAVRYLKSWQAWVRRGDAPQIMVRGLPRSKSQLAADLEAQPIDPEFINE